jgi:ankyrin repeat protein
VEGKVTTVSRYLDKRLIDETYRGRIDRVEELLAKGANPNRLASDGFTPLSRSAYAGHTALVERLLQRGADPNVTAKDGASALFWACVRGHEAIAQTLIAVGADVNAVREGDYSVLNAAIGNTTVTTALVEALIRAGASLDHKYLKMDVLQYAEWCDRQDLVRLIKRKGYRRRKR